MSAANASAASTVAMILHCSILQDQRSDQITTTTTTKGEEAEKATTTEVATEVPRVRVIMVLAVDTTIVEAVAIMIVDTVTVAATLHGQR